MLTLEQCKKILGDKAKNYSEESIELIRDQLYIAANLSFEHWKKGHCLTSGDETNTSSEVSQRLTSNPLHAGVPVDAK